jgi:hypothetical protein
MLITQLSSGSVMVRGFARLKGTNLPRERFSPFARCCRKVKQTRYYRYVGKLVVRL